MEFQDINISNQAINSTHGDSSMLLIKTNPHVMMATLNIWEKGLRETIQVQLA